MPLFFQARPRACLALFCLLLWLPGLFSLPPSDRDESRFALATRQMTETGDYVRIMNGDVPRNRKPIGIYWLQAPFAMAAHAAHVATANPIWPYRLPSLLGGIAAVLATFQIGLLLFADRRTAFFAGAMLAACVILTVEAHIAKTDAALLGATTLVQAMLARAWMAPKTMRRRHAAMFWLAMGAGILIKGPISPLVGGATALSLSVWHRRGAWLQTLRPMWGVPLMLAVVLPWLIAIGIATQGRFFTDAIGGDLGSKLAGGEEAHGGFPGLHLLLLPLLCFPSTLWVLRAAPGAWRERHQEATGFLLAWLVPCWLVFEAVPTKLPHYTLPLYPALFLLAARYGLTMQRPEWLKRASAGLLLAAAAMIGVVAAIAPLALHAQWSLGLPAAAAVGLVAFLACRGFAGWALLAAVPLYTALLHTELPRLTSLWIAPRVEAMLARQAGDDPSGRGVVAGGYAEPSLQFLAGPYIMLMPNGTSAAYAMAHGRTTAIVNDDDLTAFTAEATKLGLSPHKLGNVAGYNYSRGRPAALTIFAR
jgi:hypothetical protein